MTRTGVQVLGKTRGQALTVEVFERLSDVPPDIEWFANLGNKATRRAYQIAVEDFRQFSGITSPEDLRKVTRAHIIAWREDLKRRPLSDITVRHRLAAMSSLFMYLCDRNAIHQNPVTGVKRPICNTTEGATPVLLASQARALLDAPDADSLKGKRDRAILATLLYHGLRREELCKLKQRDICRLRPGNPALKISGKGGKIRYVPLHSVADQCISAYLAAAGMPRDGRAPLFCSLRDLRKGITGAAITPDAVYKIVRSYSAALGFEVGAHALRATAATNALENHAEIANVQEWLGHANITTTRLYDHRRQRAQDSPTFRLAY